MAALAEREVFICVGAGSLASMTTNLVGGARMGTVELPRDSRGRVLEESSATRSPGAA